MRWTSSVHQARTSAGERLNRSRTSQGMKAVAAMAGRFVF